MSSVIIALVVGVFAGALVLWLATRGQGNQRFALTMRHLQKTGRSLSTAVNSYNALVGSLENRVLPQLRRLEELGIVAHGTQVPQAQTVEAQPRPVPSAPDPLEGAAP